VPTLSGLLTSNTENRQQPLASVTAKRNDGMIAHPPQTGPMPGGHAAVETAGAAERRITAVLRAHAWPGRCVGSEQHRCPHSAPSGSPAGFGPASTPPPNTPWIMR
jgi:hypothetical protein